MGQASDNNIPGGPPMIRIDGAKVRQIREKNGLTQLYVATVVQVTTDTISRWENRRYPTIKKENAEKLAEALEVPLSDLLEEEDAPSATKDEPAKIDAGSVDIVNPAKKPENNAKPFRLWWALLLIVLAGAIGLGWFLFRTTPTESWQISAVRVLPSHVPPGQSFPVLIRVSTRSEAAFALIVRENLPPGCRVLAATPPPTGPDRKEGQLNWVSRLEGGSRLFSYLLTSPASPVNNGSISFRGQVLAGGRGSEPTIIEGGGELEIGPFHWADINSDNRIDDEEILVVYDLFGEEESFANLLDEVDGIWAAGGYRWDPESQQYLVEQ